MCNAISLSMVDAGPSPPGDLGQPADCWPSFDPTAEKSGANLKWLSLPQAEPLADLIRAPPREALGDVQRCWEAGIGRTQTVEGRSADDQEIAHIGRREELSVESTRSGGLHGHPVPAGLAEIVGSSPFQGVSETLSRDLHVSARATCRQVHCGPGR